MENKAVSDEMIFILEGEMTHFHFSNTTASLLHDIEEKTLVCDVADAISGMQVELASSSMLSLYDGEDVYNFAGLVNGKVVCGVFEEADKLKEGDNVKLVVEQRGDVLHAHSLLRIADSLLMMPLNTFCGERAFFWNCMKFARNISISVWIILFAGFFLFVDVSLQKKEDLIAVFCLILLLPPLFCFPFEYWTYKSMINYSIYAERIFTAYGIPRPDEFDAQEGITRFEYRGSNFFAINLELAMKKHKKKFCMPSI